MDSLGYNTKLVILLIIIGMGITIIINQFWRPKPKKRLFSIKFLFNLKNISMAVNAVTLNDLNPHVGTLVLVDNFGNTYTGTFSNGQVTGFDAAEDKVTIDPSDPSKIDVQALTAEGTATATVTGDWTSNGNATVRPNPDPTKPGSKAIPDGTVLTGVTGPLSITNDISRTFSIQSNF